jgi:hypothetical protein
MKKFLGMLVLVSVVAMMTGCATVHKFGSENAYALSGQVPKVGQIINVISVIGREKQGPYEYLMVWEPTDEGGGGARIMVMTGGHCLVDPKSEGEYLVQKDVETVIKFTRLEQ